METKETGLEKCVKLLEKKLIFYPVLTGLALGASYGGSFIGDQKFFNQVNSYIKLIIDYIP